MLQFQVCTCKVEALHPTPVPYFKNSICSLQNYYYYFFFCRIKIKGTHSTVLVCPLNSRSNKHVDFPQVTKVVLRVLLPFTQRGHLVHKKVQTDYTLYG